MPVPGQPADVTPQHRIDLPDPPELPVQPGARRRRHRERLGIRRLDPVVGAHVDDHAGPVSPPGEVVRGVPPPTTLTRPVQPERLRRDTGDLRVEIKRPDMITLQPGLIPDMPASRRRPPPAREMPEPPRPAELAHRHPVLEPNPRARGQRRPPLHAAVNEPQLEAGTSGLHPPGRSPQNGHHIRDDPEPGKLRWRDTPDEQDPLAKRKINCHRTRSMSVSSVVLCKARVPFS